VLECIATIGVYGFDGASFIQALRAAGIDLLIDVRARRGVRGKEYAFANARRLIAALAEAGICYVHAKEVAPSKAVRDAQRDADAAAGIAKRQRASVADAFVAAYQREVLTGLDARAFVESHFGDARRPVLLCVEREPAACHRALLAERLGADLGISVEHLGP
jgi:uncharacterized protein (DUF488 family)